MKGAIMKLLLHVIWILNTTKVYQHFFDSG